jgi:hypothetical protein
VVLGCPAAVADELRVTGLLTTADLPG